ncbi:MAG: glycosyltransferase family 2 protein [Balneola sp.]
MEKISVVIPTYNRHYLMDSNIKMYSKMSCVDEIIVIDDSEKEYPFNNDSKNVNIIYQRNETKKGAAYNRFLGLKKAKNRYVLLSEDDIIIDEAYLGSSLELIKKNDCSASSGQIIYLKKNEDIKTAKSRYFNQRSINSIFNRITLGVKPNKKFKEKTIVPYSHAVTLVDTLNFKNTYDFELHAELMKYNGFREESVLQYANTITGNKVLISPEFLVYHLHKSKVKKGGQRVSILGQIKGKVINTYIFIKYFHNRDNKLGIISPKTHMIFYILFLMGEYIIKTIKRVFK